MDFRSLFRGVFIALLGAFAGGYLKLLILALWNLPLGGKILRLIACLKPEIIHTIFVLGLVLVLYASLFLLDWLPKISSPMGLKLLRIALIVENLCLMTWFYFKVIWDAYYFSATIDNIIFQIALQYCIAFIVVFTLLTSYKLLVRVPKERYRLVVTGSHPIVQLIMAMSLFHVYGFWALFKGHYWALAHFPSFLGLLYFSLMFPTIFVATTMLMYLMVCYFILPDEALLQLGLKSNHALLLEQFFAAGFYFVVEVTVIGFGWLCTIWFWFEGHLPLLLDDILTILFYSDP